MIIRAIKGRNSLKGVGKKFVGGGGNGKKDQKLAKNSIICLFQGGQRKKTEKKAKKGRK